MCVIRVPKQHSITSSSEENKSLKFKLFKSKSKSARPSQRKSFNGF